MVARTVRDREAVGSKPAISTNGENCTIACFRFFKAKSALTFVFAVRAKRDCLKQLVVTYRWVFFKNKILEKGIDY